LYKILDILEIGLTDSEATAVGLNTAVCLYIYEWKGLRLNPLPPKSNTFLN
jgi:hypothetical protein